MDPKIKAQLVAVFKQAWEDADEREMAGHRTEAGIEAVMAALPPIGEGWQIVNGWIVERDDRYDELVPLVDLRTLSGWTSLKELF